MNFHGRGCHARKASRRPGRCAKGIVSRESLTLASAGRSRHALLASASIIALAAIGLPGAARAACAPALQTISGPVAGPVVSNGGAITVTGTGAISGGPDGVDALTCNITTLTNQSGGTIGGGAGGVSASGGVGVLNSQTIATLANSGTISGRAGGGSFFAAKGGAGGVGVSNPGTITTLTNSGRIAGGNGGTGFGLGFLGLGGLRLMERRKPAPC